MLEKRELEMRDDEGKAGEKVDERLGRGWHRERADYARRVLIIAGGKKRDGTFVAHRSGDAMNLFVKPRNRGENKREKKGADAARGGDRPKGGSSAVIEAQAHLLRECGSTRATMQARYLRS